MLIILASVQSISAGCLGEDFSGIIYVDGYGSVSVSMMWCGAILIWSDVTHYCSICVGVGLEILVSNTSVTGLISFLGAVTLEYLLLSIFP